MTVKNAPLLERLRRRLWAGDTVTEAARALGITRDRAQGLIRRHGRGAGPIVVHPPAPPLTGCPRDGGCMWPTSASRPWVFCDSPRVSDGPYCREHQARAFQPHRPRLGLPLTFLRLAVS